jgi:uncharacterized membrane protein YdfJ with MMPL/SSD domain
MSVGTVIVSAGLLGLSQVGDVATYFVAWAVIVASALALLLVPLGLVMGWRRRTGRSRVRQAKSVLRRSLKDAEQELNRGIDVLDHSHDRQRDAPGGPREQEQRYQQWDQERERERDPRYEWMR